MKAEEYLRQGDPAAALDALQGDIRNNPADPKMRVFLFQLLSITGQWDRATTQLDTLKDMDPATLAMVHVYRDVINCEKHRQAVFAGQAQPLLLGEPEPWLADLIQAQQSFAQGDFEAFATHNARAFEAAPALSGRLNDEPFEWLADADQRLGPVFEVIFNQHYYWVPVDRIVALEVEEPADLRDLVWVPAEITWVNGGQNMVMMPSRYPRLEGASGEDLLARKTDWVQHADDVWEGTGQRVLVTDASETPFLHVRTIEFDHD